MRTVKFLTNVTVDNVLRGTAEETTYKEGQTVDLSESAARHWLNRNKAVEVVRRKRRKAADRAEPETPGEDDGAPEASQTDLIGADQPQADDDSTDG